MERLHDRPFQDFVAHETHRLIPRFNNDAAGFTRAREAEKNIVKALGPGGLTARENPVPARRAVYGKNPAKLLRIRFA